MGQEVLKDVKAQFSKANDAVTKAQTVEAIEQVRVHYLGKKGLVTEQLKQLKHCSDAERQVVGTCLNEGKQSLFRSISEKKHQLEQARLHAKLQQEKIDISLPGRGIDSGSRHPVTLVQNRIVSLFEKKYGFVQASGPEIVDTFHNFTALNMGEDHPARAMHDTFYLKGNDQLLRTHTSCVQIKTMMGASPPFRVVAAGRVFRKDSDLTHTPMFHQLEGFVVDKKSSFADLKLLITDFLQTFFEKELTFRFRSSYFPFTEPSAEVDIMGPDGWLEVLGCGMIHPKVLESCGIDFEQYQGYAFGFGIDRLAMLWYGIDDLRLFFANEPAFLQQFDDE
jgi:phenylalanyl-tRNA synthetase alpha chain